MKSIVQFLVHSECSVRSLMAFLELFVFSLPGTLMNTQTSASQTSKLGQLTVSLPGVGLEHLCVYHSLGDADLLV